VLKSKELPAGDKKNLLYTAYVLCLTHLLLGAKFNLILQIMLEDRFCLSYITFIGFNLKVSNRRYASVRLTTMLQIRREGTVYL
jgi:hypothetical protein